MQGLKFSLKSVLAAFTFVTLTVPFFLSVGQPQSFVLCAAILGLFLLVMGETNKVRE